MGSRLLPSLGSKKNKTHDDKAIQRSMGTGHSIRLLLSIAGAIVTRLMKESHMMLHVAFNALLELT